MITTTSDQIRSTDPAPPPSGTTSELVTQRGCHVGPVLPTDAPPWSALRLRLGGQVAGDVSRVGHQPVARAGGAVAAGLSLDGLLSGLDGDLAGAFRRT